MALNFTSTKPSASDTSFFTHQGNVPSPVCWSTCFGLGAVASSLTAQRGAPLPVTPDSQPSGSPPGRAASKFSVFIKPSARKLKQVPVLFRHRSLVHSDGGGNVLQPGAGRVEDDHLFVRASARLGAADDFAELRVDVRGGHHARRNRVMYISDRRGEGGYRHDRAGRGDRRCTSRDCGGLHGHVGNHLRRGQKLGL